MPSGDDLDRAAERFDALYTAMTVLQRDLIAARRNGANVAEVRALCERAHVFTSAYAAAEAAASIGRPNARAVEAAALRARLLVPPIDEHLLFAAIASQPRAYGFPILADALAQAARDDALDAAVGQRTATDVLSTARGMGRATAARLAEHLELDPDAAVTDLTSDQIERLHAGLREFARGLPDGVEDWRRRGPKASGDGVGGGPAVVAAWASEIGRAGDRHRSAAIEASRRDGWPADALPAAKQLLAFTLAELAPGLIPEWDRIAAAGDDEERMALLRSERSAWSHPQTDEEALVRWVLDRLLVAIKQARTADRLNESPADRWGSTTPLAAARGVARRCGEVLSMVEEDVAIELLAGLPGAPGTT